MKQKNTNTKDWHWLTLTTSGAKYKWVSFRREMELWLRPPTTAIKVLKFCRWRSFWWPEKDMLMITVYCVKRWPSALLLVLGVLVWSVAIYSIIVLFFLKFKFKNRKTLFNFVFMDCGGDVNLKAYQQIKLTPFWNHSTWILELFITVLISNDILDWWQELKKKVLLPLWLSE